MAFNCPGLDERLAGIFVETTSINSPSGSESHIASYIRSFIEGLGFEVQCDGAASLSGGDSGNLIVPLLGGGNFFLAAHMDTPRPTTGLVHVFRGDRITSDGTTPLGVDDRGGVSAILYALERAVKAGTLKPATLLFTVCEETSLAGSTFFTPAEGITHGFVFDSYMRPGNFVRETCGLIDFTIHIKGKSSHAGISPEKGVNALQIAGECISAFPFGRRGPLATANIGMVSGGTGTNVICDDLKLCGEIRSACREEGEAKYAEVLEKFGEICASRGGFLTESHAWDFVPYRIEDGDQPYIRFAAAARSLGLEPSPQPSMGGSDANALNAKGIPTMNIGVGAQNPHGNDEFILYEDLQAASDIAYKLLTE
ncbi:MAG: M20/M25/M40 family metallo-hydrolase [Bacteroidales bacterium]|nr:M20/M25/M40 family metallo-hydrolase [Bacteroidales bacterium]